MQTASEAECSVPGCGKPAKQSGMCYGHSRRRDRGTSLTPPIRPYRQSEWARVVDASIAVADAETDVDLERAKRRLRAAVGDWFAKGAA